MTDALITNRGSHRPPWTVRHFLALLLRWVLRTVLWKE